MLLSRPSCSRLTALVVPSLPSYSLVLPHPSCFHRPPRPSCSRLVSPPVIHLLTGLPLSPLLLSSSPLTPLALAVPSRPSFSRLPLSPFLLSPSVNSRRPLSPFCSNHQDHHHGGSGSGSNHHDHHCDQHHGGSNHHGEVFPFPFFLCLFFTLLFCSLSFLYFAFRFLVFSFCWF